MLSSKMLHSEISYSTSCLKCGFSVVVFSHKKKLNCNSVVCVKYIVLSFGAIMF